MGRSYLTVRALVVTVTCLVCLEYFSLLQSAEPPDQRRLRPVFRVVEGKGEQGRWRYRRHILQAIDLEKLLKHNHGPDQDLKNAKAAREEKPEKNENADFETGGNFSLGAGPRPTEGEQCSMIPPGLHGRFPVTLTDIPSLDEMAKEFPQLEKGGIFRPKGCEARHRVAIIVPYRDREPHLRAFLLNIHRFLQRQQVMYGVYVVEQDGNTPFNRAMLMNVGAAEAVKQQDFQCFIFHDVDLLPEDDRNLYTCPIQPRHMSVSIDSFLYRLPYDDIFGGVSALTVDQFQLVNGFSNMFWGWGGEDDDMANRLRIKKLFISRYPANIARYKMLKHAKDKANPERFKYLYSGAKRMGKDGYNSLKYKKVKLELRPLYTWVLVDLPRLKA